MVHRWPPPLARLHIALVGGGWNTVGGQNRMVNRGVIRPKKSISSGAYQIPGLFPRTDLFSQTSTTKVWADPSGTHGLTPGQGNKWYLTLRRSLEDKIAMWYSVLPLHCCLRSWGGLVCLESTWDEDKKTFFQKKFYWCLQGKGEA